MEESLMKISAKVIIQIIERNGKNSKIEIIKHFLRNK